MGTMETDSRLRTDRANSSPTSGATLLLPSRAQHGDREQAISANHMSTDPLVKKALREFNHGLSERRPNSTGSDAAKSLLREDMPSWHSGGG